MVLTTHLFLVHDEMIPNITPALDPSFRPKEVYLLCSQESINQTERLEILLKQTGIAVFRWPVSDPWDIEHIREHVLEFAVNHDHIDIALNVTGGTKPMSLAAYEVFKDTGKPVYYVHTNQDYVVWLNPHDRKPFDLENRMKLPTYFSAHGMALIEGKKELIAENLRELTATLVNKVNLFSKPLTILNCLASSAVHSLVSPPLDETQLKFQPLRELLDLFSHHNLISLDQNNRLHFTSDEARFYVNGGWLEEHIYSILFHMQKEIRAIQDIARNVIVDWADKNKKAPNEIDIAFLADNHLYLIECKTRIFDGNKSQAKSAAEALYKLDAFQTALGGEKTVRAMIVSYRRFPESAKIRARKLTIEVCDQGNLVHLDNALKFWIKK